MVAERFTSSYRTCYAGPAPMTAMRPALALGCYRPWQPALPCAAVAAEDTAGTRSPSLRHDWPGYIEPAARKALSSLGRPPVIAGWYATSLLRALAGPSGAVAAIDGALRDILEDKAGFGQLLRDAGVPGSVQIASVRVDGRLPALADLRRRVGATRIVVQAGVTSGGRGTVFVDDEVGLAEAARMPGPYRVTAFTEGWSSNVTVLSVPRPGGGIDVYVDQPSHKAIAVRELGIGTAKSAGNDWSPRWPRPAAELLAETAVRIGEWAWERHRMAGLFGLDAILAPGGQVKVNEINCRNQGTTEVSAVNQQLRGYPPFVVAHLAVMLGGRVDWLGDPAEYNQETLRRAADPGPAPFYAKLRHAGPAPARVSPDFPGSGVYRFTGDGLRWARHGAHPADADADRGELLLAGIPGPDVTCHPGAEIATLEGVTTGPGRPFAGPHTAAPHLLQAAAAIRSQLIPVKEPRP